MSKRLYVGNLPTSATEQDLSRKFSACGTVDSIKLITDRDTGGSRGFGFIEMGSEAEGRAAIETFNNTEFDGRPIKVSEAKPQSKGGAGRRWEGSG